ncbi:MAG: class I SAM-dependent methyltransferase [Alphaproteobacteria bacterium]|nr:class I SAM-dependent methyltransferase [Alphaproteobacteria bacterium]
MPETLAPPLSPAQHGFSSAAYWEQRYRSGGHSGAGSYGRLAGFKATVLNRLVRDNGISTAMEFGCGDGNQLAMLEVSDYVGLDVSPAAIATCLARFAGRQGRTFRLMQERDGLAAAELTLSLDVIYHLVEDEVFAAYMQALFDHSWRYVVVYARDVDQGWASPHVRHRRFTSHVARHFPEWRLAAVLPNLYPYDPLQPDETSFAAFHIYAQPHEALRLAIPGRED